MDPRDLTIIANTGDDIVLHGLAHLARSGHHHLYAGGRGESRDRLGLSRRNVPRAEQLAVYGRPAWFNLGDRDLATHIHRTAMLREGATLSEAAESIRIALGVQAQILPMSDQPVPTMIDTEEGRLHLQEYLVQKRAEPVVRKIEFVGIERALPAPGVLESLERAAVIVICPSNPLISIGPILAVPGVREALRKRREDVVAVCPIVGGKSLKGPSDRMLAQLGFDVSASGVARMYQDICARFLIDSVDAGERLAVEALGMKAVVCSTVMHTLEDKERLAGEALRPFVERTAGAGR